MLAPVLQHPGSLGVADIGVCMLRGHILCFIILFDMMHACATKMSSIFACTTENGRPKRVGWQHARLKSLAGLVALYMPIYALSNSIGKSFHFMLCHGIAC